MALLLCCWENIVSSSSNTIAFTIISKYQYISHYFYMLGCTRLFYTHTVSATCACATFFKPQNTLLRRTRESHTKCMDDLFACDTSDRILVKRTKHPCSSYYFPCLSERSERNSLASEPCACGRIVSRLLH